MSSVNSKNRRTVHRKELQLSDDFSSVSLDKECLPQVPAKSNFTIHSRSTNPCREYISASRRDYYKITLMTKGGGIMTLGQRSYVIKAPAIVFINQLEPKTWQPEGEQDGYYCRFTENLFEMHRHSREELLHHPLFQTGANPVLSLTEQQRDYMLQLFGHLLKENKDCNPYRQEAILIYLQLLLLEAKRIGAPEVIPHRSLTTAQLLAERFTDTLEKQFPITSELEQIQLKTAGDFAQVLNVHPNHLNATVKRVTGRTTSEHIRQRMLLEARLLLLHTDWPIAAIAHSLGFEEPANFSHFFKSQTGHTPHTFRML
ncbi:helix-turn-helix domain-containing protein [Chitinophaga rhizophila]|uniref:Helix-turn-helix domain-containing protein n=1 Tax=Chitinophaga rhizophila TaxID=2866212 RepID=A0ABS7GEK5_9BACT|nr:helix-turn-helix domain-containing protein [Chitinophaga rhizophila]MBW8685836.1 helix-turn-helix domain-containing protein [Chitinophaga rhizophila]